MGARQTLQRSRQRPSSPALLPKPKRLSLRRGEFRLRTAHAIGLPTIDLPFDPDANHARRLELAAEACRDEIRARTGLELVVDAPGDVLERADGPITIRCRFDPGAALDPARPTASDAYRLEVGPAGVDLAAPSVDGLCFGLQTLAQLVKPGGRIPALRILDQPDFVDRGIMLDVSRGKVPDLHTLEALVDLCARLRLNVLMLYVEHTFAFRAHPEIGRNASPLDAETIRALDAFAADRGVELIPCLQSLGHMEHILSLERYAKLAESDRRWSLTPSRPETYRLLGELYDEFLPLFHSKRFNANCDEPFDLGRGQSAERAPEKSPGRLFAEHVAQLERLARRHDKQLMVWADFALKHPDQLDAIGRDVAMLDWWYEAEFDFDRIERLRRQGFEVWVCPGTSSWNCLFPRVETSCRNVASWAAAGRRHDARGLLNTDWGDFGHYNALGLSFHAYAWGAQQAWSGDVPSGEFDRAFASRVFGERNARLARLYRRLGKIHDAGFPVANGSALQYLYFDPLSRSFFLQHVKRRALESSARRLERVEAEVAALDLANAHDDFFGLARREIAWSTDATGLAIEKGLVALDYNAWRATPGSLRAADRRRLARRLERLADRQRTQLKSLEELWLARNAISEFHKTRKRIRGSITSLRDAARRLHDDRPGRPPRETELGPLDVFNEVRRAFGLAPR